MKKWEYKRVVVVPNYNLTELIQEESTLKKEGVNGWELCAATTASGFTYRVFYFKREIIENVSTINPITSQGSTES